MSTPGSVRLRFFARYAEVLGRAEASLTLPLPATVRDVVNRVRTEFPGGDQLPERPLAAVNLRHARLESSVTSGDEVAFLPALNGG